MGLSRSETISVLKSMGLELPADTKLSDETLDKRLRDALNAAQQKDGLPASLDLRSLSPWPTSKFAHSKDKKKPLLDAVQRGNIGEAAHNYARKSRVPELYVDSFMDLRQTIMGFAHFIDQGVMRCVIQDQEKENYAINVRVISVLEVDEKTPAIVVLYRSFDKSTAMEGAEWVCLQTEPDSSPVPSGSIINITATPLEQKLLLKLLKLNQHFIPSDFDVKRHPTEATFRLSVLFPIGPLDFAARTKLSHNMGCGVCGRRATSRCGQCQSVSYCSAECQRADWSTHKTTCRQLKGGRWCPVRIRAGLPGLTENAHMMLLNRYTRVAADAAAPVHKIDPNDPPPNVWGERAFIIKLQLNLVSDRPGEPPHMMVYDRKRSFQVFVLSEDDPDVFLALLEEIAGPRGGYRGAKMYRWARRTGDWGLSICLDRVPAASDTNW
ncbi:hypothetical protein OH76DRAFT_1413096 [Lentinus brumalis]|uniref:MYND-type domain-containing protein n=1 Tax=Lentinus brumalis TaxID=2498619 RepID=A0A371CIZ9_9APHY|nr:hypothetical protein OH76DRAFT_1413096 [Polyporus brumalis]